MIGLIVNRLKMSLICLMIVDQLLCAALIRLRIGTVENSIISGGKLGRRWKVNYSGNKAKLQIIICRLGSHVSFAVCGVFDVCRLLCICFDLNHPYDYCLQLAWLSEITF